MEWEQTCKNGVQIIARTAPYLHRFSAILELGCGSAYESEARGITHVMEHCIMRGMTVKYGTDFYGLLTRHGLELDAWTNSETMRLELHGDPSGAAFAAELVEQLLTPFGLDEEGFRIEKGRILAEISLNGTSGIAQNINDLAGAGSGYWQDVFGSVEAVEGFTLEQLENHRRAVLKAGRVRLCLTGCLSREDLDRFARAAERIPIEPGDFPFPEPLMPLYFCERNGDWAFPNDYRDHLELVYDVDAYHCSLEGLMVLGSILKIGCDALLYQELSEKRGLVYHCGSSVRFLPLGAVLHIGFSYDPQRLPETIDTLRLALERLLAGDFDLEAKKRFTAMQWRWDMDDPREYGRDLLHLLRLRGIPEIPEFMDVTMEEVIDCAREIFGKGRFLSMRFCCGQISAQEETIQAALDRLRKVGSETV